RSPQARRRALRLGDPTTRNHAEMTRTLRVVCFFAAVPALGAAADNGTITLEIKDWATAPITGQYDGKGQTDGMLARINSFREEPGGAKRIWIPDLNGPLYIVDRATKTFTTDLTFNGREGK